MTFADRLFDALAAERVRLGGVLPKDRWLEVVNATAQAEGIARKRKPKGAARARNPLFDALALASGTIGSLDQVTRLSGQTIGVALADIMAVCPGLTVEEIRRVCAAYKKRWPDPRNWSAPAVAKHWPEFAGDGKPTRTGVGYAPEPANWRPAAKLVADRTESPNLRDTRLEAADGWDWLQIGPEFRTLIFEELGK